MTQNIIANEYLFVSFVDSQSRAESRTLTLHLGKPILAVVPQFIFPFIAYQNPRLHSILLVIVAFEAVNSKWGKCCISISLIDLALRSLRLKGMGQAYSSLGDEEARCSIQENIPMMEPLSKVFENIYQLDNQLIRAIIIQDNKFKFNRMLVSMYTPLKYINSPSAWKFRCNEIKYIFAIFTHNSNHILFYNQHVLEVFLQLPQTIHIIHRYGE